MAPNSIILFELCKMEMCLTVQLVIDPHTVIDSQNIARQNWWNGIYGYCFNSIFYCI